MFIQKPTIKLKNKSRYENNENNNEEFNSNFFNDENEKNQFKKFDKKFKKKLQDISPIRNRSDCTIDSELFDSNKNINNL
jgi:hypothetical protein